MANSSKALLLIDFQNDYFPGGAFPLWNTTQTLENTLKLIEQARSADILPIHVQHVADPKMGLSPFFNHGTSGVEIHPAVLAAAPDSPIVVKSYADSFVNTTLESTLQQFGIRELLVCGMMTQNCVTHTAISKSAEKYDVCILSDCCTTVGELLHLIALHAVSTRMRIASSAQALQS